jgi:hypothetical protein
MIRPFVLWKRGRRATRLTALMVVVVFALTLSAPAPAEADPVTALAIAGAAVVVVILVVYLIIASSSDSRMASSEPVMLACIRSEIRPRDCWSLGQPEHPVDIESILVPPSALPRHASQVSP